jgi:hypothetical protein
MALYFGKTLQDGKLTPTSGRIVIYKDAIEVSQGPSRDHNDLLRALASKFRLPKDLVISGAARLYWDHTGKDIVICPVRKIDEDQFYAQKEFNTKLICAALKI